MAGTKTGEFKELLSPFLKSKLKLAKQNYGITDIKYKVLHNQYIKSEFEAHINSKEKRRHYESEISTHFENKKLIGLERLYRRTILIEPTTACAAHCRWCVRGQYSVKTMNKEQIILAARYIGSEKLQKDIDELIITGGDPLTSIPLLDFTLNAIKDHAPNIKTIRIHSRIPFHEPKRINCNMLNTLAKYKTFHLKIGIHVNHPSEFWQESVTSLEKLQAADIKLYNQHPLLKGVNDDIKTLIELYDMMRHLNIEAHYMFHASPVRGMSHHRTSVKRGLELASELSSCGHFSGRAKPHYALLTDIGKVIVYQDSILEKNEDNHLLVKTGYQVSERKAWSAGWLPPENVVVTDNGRMNVWYLDGLD